MHSSFVLIFLGGVGLCFCVFFLIAPLPPHTHRLRIARNLVCRRRSLPSTISMGVGQLLICEPRPIWLWPACSSSQGPSPHLVTDQLPHLKLAASQLHRMQVQSRHGQIG